MSLIASPYKVTHHRKKVEDYLHDEPIMPVTVELDISTECNKRCLLCPSTTSLYSSTLKLGFIERLFVRLKGQTRGLLLSGGEPTLSPIFPKVLRLARKNDFSEIAIVTNGSLLDKERVAEALCEHASTIRVSIYDWTEGSGTDLKTTFQRIKSLRSRIENEGSNLQIGISALTSMENRKAIHSIIREANSAGAHWIYFHPMCNNWETGAPERVNQSGVLEIIGKYKEKRSDDFCIFTFPERYEDSKLDFSGYHAAHFLLVIGADGMNYIGAETKYHPKYIIADLTKNWNDNFLWEKERLKRIESVNSRIYPLTSRHRGILYNQVIQDLINNGIQSIDNTSTTKGTIFVFPNIL